MTTIRAAMCVLLMSACLGAVAAEGAQGGRGTGAPKPTYDQLVSAGYVLLTEGKPRDAYVAAMEAAKADPSRFESYALAALVMHGSGANADAREFVERALGLAPSAKKPKLRELAQAINESLASGAPSATAVQPAKPGAPPPPPAGSTSLEFDTAKKVKLSGKITKIEFVDQEPWTFFDVGPTNGTPQTWVFKGITMEVLKVLQYTVDDLPIGATVDVEGYLARDGVPVIHAVEFTLKDPKRMK